MDIITIANAIDQEISTRSSDKFGIKVGGELYKALAEVGRIKMSKFSVLGIGAQIAEFPSYDGKYFIFHDWTLTDFAYEVGMPRP